MLIAFSLLLLIARLFAEGFKKLKFPAVIGEIVAGIVIGPSLLGYVAPDIQQVLFPKSDAMSLAMDVIVQLSVIMLLFVAGMEVELQLLFKQSRAALTTGAFSILIPLAIGFAAASFMPAWFAGQTQGKSLFPFFIGIALSISALPVIIRILMDVSMFHTPIGRIIIAAAVFSDVVGWLLFSIVLSMINGVENSMQVGLAALLVVCFVVFMFTLGKKILNHRIRWISANMKLPGAAISFLMGLCFLGAACTEAMGLHAMLGAFIMGIAVGDSKHLDEKPREIIHQFVTSVFAPLFFVSIGLRVNFITNFNLQVVMLVLFLALVTKLLGAGIGARISGFTLRQSLAIGFGLNARGAMEIILGTIALNTGLINETLFVALVVMALLTSIMSGPMLLKFSGESKSLRER
jgi:Kef-type K+ transport system membrane component KefB